MKVLEIERHIIINSERVIYKKAQYVEFIQASRDIYDQFSKERGKKKAHRFIWNSFLLITNAVLIAIILL